MSKQHRRRLVPEAVCVWNIQLDRRLRPYSVNLTKWKLIRAVIVTVAVMGFSVFAISEGAEPTTTALLALLLVGLLNGIDLAELVSVWAEIQLNGQDGQNDDEG